MATEYTKDRRYLVISKSEVTRKTETREELERKKRLYEEKINEINILLAECDKLKI